MGIRPADSSAHERASLDTVQDFIIRRNHGLWEPSEHFKNLAPAMEPSESQFTHNDGMREDPTPFQGSRQSGRA